MAQYQVQTRNKRVNTDRPKLRRFALQLWVPGYAKRWAQKIMITHEFFKSIPSKEGSIDDFVRWFMKCHRNACVALSMKSTHHKGSLEVSIGPYDSGEKRDPYLSIMHGSSWGFESFEQVSLELLLPTGEYDDTCWFRVDSPDDPLEEWEKFCKASGVIHCLNVKGCKYNMDFGSHDG